jgi:hypothetical protein
MSDFALADDHDIDTTNQELTLVEDTVGDPAAIAQELGIALLFHRGEWKQNVLVGIPYMEQVFVKNPSIAGIAVLFTRAARSVAGIVEVMEMVPEFDNSLRSLELDFRARAQDGGVIEDRLAVVL